MQPLSLKLYTRRKPRSRKAGSGGRQPRPPPSGSALLAQTQRLLSLSYCFECVFVYDGQGKLCHRHGSLSVFLFYGGNTKSWWFAWTQEMNLLARVNLSCFHRCQHANLTLPVTITALTLNTLNNYGDARLSVDTILRTIERIYFPNIRFLMCFCLEFHHECMKLLSEMLWQPVITV